MTSSIMHHLVEYACLEGYRNMALDRRLLALCEQDPSAAFVRFYTWVRPTLSMGHFEPLDVVDGEAARRDGVDLVRRPTGGRVVLHGDDLTYTVVVPGDTGTALRETYSLISEILVQGLRSLGAQLDIQRGITGRSQVVKKPCFASVSRYEITHRGRKVVGSAQRLGERAILQHGSIPLGGGYLGVVQYMNIPGRDREKLLAEMRSQTSCLNDILGRHTDPKEAVTALGAAFGEALGCEFVDVSIADLEEHDELSSPPEDVNPTDKSP
jgi:lipoate-protein ligase A